MGIEGLDFLDTNLVLFVLEGVVCTLGVALRVKREHDEGRASDRVCVRDLQSLNIGLARGGPDDDDVDEIDVEVALTEM